MPSSRRWSRRGGAGRNRYLVFTSADIRAGHMPQRFAPQLYERVMLRLNDEFVEVARAAPLKD